MYSFFIALALLIVGYFVYGRIVEKVFSPDDRPTPVTLHSDGVESVAMPTWKMFIIQFLNIAGTGPIIGAILGAAYGPAAFLWIVLGSIFGGAVHDYLSGMYSIRNNGEDLPNLIGRFLGKNTKGIMLVFLLVLLILVGALFVYTPTDIITKYFGNPSLFWICAGIIIIYFLLAAVFPINTIIGKFYPVFSLLLAFMAIAVFVVLIGSHASDMQEFWEPIGRGKQGGPLFPCLFVSLACGAISGFHATQCPIVARCIKSERKGRQVFYGAMIAEGIIALIWAATAMVVMKSQPGAPIPVIVTICKKWLTPVSIIALLGVVIAPITTGATAVRSARLIISDFFHLNQKQASKRLYLCLFLLSIVLALVALQKNDEKAFGVVWLWFGWANQALSVFTLFAMTVALYKEKKGYWISLIPALFMTGVCAAFPMFGVPRTIDLIRHTHGETPFSQLTIILVGVLAAMVALALFHSWKKKHPVK